VTLGLRLYGGGAETSEARTGAVRVEDILAVAFDAASILPLASIPPDVQSPAAGRRWSEPLSIADARSSVLGAPDITLPGPMTVDWPLPPHAASFGADVELPP